jgi:hypothetical protein
MSREKGEIVYVLCVLWPNEGLRHYSVACSKEKGLAYRKPLI